MLTKRSNAQRQQIAKSFKAQFGKARGRLVGVGIGEPWGWGYSLGGSSILDDFPEEPAHTGSMGTWNLFARKQLFFIEIQM